MISLNLKNLRKELNLTQVTLSKITGISVSQIVQYEKGLSIPTLKDSIELAKIFEVDPEYFTDNTKTLVSYSLSRQIERIVKVVESEDDLKLLTDFVDFLYYKKESSRI